MDLRKKLEDFESAMCRLEEAYLKARKTGYEEYPYFRDSAIQRFEFTVELFWKSVKLFMREIEGVDCRSPKSCVREFFSAGYLDEVEATMLLQMIDDRNMTSHTYREEIAERIFAKLENYIKVLKEVASRINLRLKNKGSI